jgi:hypothetical protein
MRDDSPQPVQVHEIQKLARAPRPGLLRELYAFLREHRKWWLAPIVVSVLLLGLLVLLGGGAAQPFIYTLF